MSFDIYSRTQFKYWKYKYFKQECTNKCISRELHCHTKVGLKGKCFAQEDVVMPLFNVVFLTR